MLRAAKVLRRASCVQNLAGLHRRGNCSHVRPANRLGCPQKEIFWPRGQNKDFIFTAGNVRPLDEALQHCSSEMLRWLVDDYDLSLPDANILLGMYVQYDVGNVYDPAYTMICKIPKSVLPEPNKDALVSYSA